MSVTIRETKLKKNRVRLSLDIYYQGKNKYENLGIFLYEKPTTKDEREHNAKTKALAESIRAKRILEIQDHKFGVASAKGQSSFLSYFKSLTDQRQRQEREYGNWYSTYKHLCNFTNHQDIKFIDVNEAFFNRFKDYLLSGRVKSGNRNLQSNSAASYLNKIKTALNQALLENIISENPAKRVKGIKLQDSQREFLLLDELKKMAVTTCEIPVLKDAFMFSCLTGLRYSDVEKLLWREVIFSEAEDRYKIHFIQKKTKGAQYHPISKEAYKLLGRRQADDQKVFNGLKNSAWHNIRLRQWVMNAGISKKITFHSSRHTYAVLLLTYGGDIYTVSSLLGHANLKTTQVYAKIIDTKKNNVVDLLPSIGI